MPVRAVRLMSQLNPSTINPKSKPHMKPFHLLTAGLALTAGMASCTGTAQSENRLAGDTLKVTATDTIHHWVCSTDIKAFYPRTTSSPLAQNIREWMSEQTGGRFEGSLDNGQALLDSAAQQWKTDCRDMLKDMPSLDRPSASAQMAQEITLLPLYETDRFITYGATRYQFTGGAHGMQALTGTTFRKTDGRRFGWEMFRTDAQPKLQEEIRKGLMTYFHVTTDEALQEMLFEQESPILPLPVTPPYLTRDGVTFVYQSYEIAPYAAGQPTVTLPYAQALPLMTTTARQLVEPQAKP